MYEHNRISYEARERVRRREREAASERIARSACADREASLRRHLHGAMAHLLAQRGRLTARQSE